MSDQLIINSAPYEMRIALLEGGIITELIIERNADKSLVGNIYLGKVQRVLPGMQAAFVELGIGKAAFLFVGDVVKSQPSIDSQDATEEPMPHLVLLEKDKDKEEPEEKKNKVKDKHKIELLLKPGQDILVQVTKDPISTKGPRISCNISIPGRYVVFMPDYDHIGISRKITDEDERERLKNILIDQKSTNTGFGFVARTISQGVHEDKIKNDCQYLMNLWQEILAKKSASSAPKLIQPELDLLLKCTRDLNQEAISRMVIDNKESYLRVKDFLQKSHDSFIDKVELYDKKMPIFDFFGIESEITRAMSRKVWLKSGGYLVIDQAEALTVIDVNTGKFVGKRNLDETILKTNLEAVKEAAYQLRLRNIGGMVIIDFIDMENNADRDQVLQALIDALKKDKARSNVVKISELGLVEMTRQRTKESLERKLCERCFYCDGKGTLKSRQTIAYEIFREIYSKGREILEPNIIVHAHPEVVDVIYSDEQESLSKLEKIMDKQVQIKPRGSFHQEQFDIFGAKENV